MAGMKKASKILKFEKPSSWWGALWRGGIPLGNGITGACVYGGAANDTVMLTSANSLWQGVINVLPDVSDKLKEVRKLLDDGQYFKAENVISDALISKNYRPSAAVPLPVCDFNINMPLEKLPKDYYRALNTETGEAVVSYRDGSAKYDRQMFVSRSQDLFVMEINKSGKQTINAKFSFDMHDRNCARTPGGVYSKLPEAVITSYQPFFMYYGARADNGLEFGAVAKISYYGGTQEVKKDCLCVKGANKVLVVIKVFTQSQREKEWKNLKAELSANKQSYDKMLRQHAKLHSDMFSKTEMDLRAEDREQSIETLLKDGYISNANTALLEKLWYFGRYLFISSAREDGSLLVNPYGLWCGDYKAVDSYPDFSGKTQSLYRFAFDNNLGGLIVPLLNFFESVLADLKKNAQRLYNCRGIFIPTQIAAGTGLLGSVNSKDIHFIAATAEIAAMFYDYYCYCGNRKFLKERAMPFMKEAVTFFEDFLKLDDNGYYTVYPSYSPEGCPGNLLNGDNGINLYIAKDSEADFAAIRQLLKYIIEGSGICGLYGGEVEKWKDMLSKLPKPKIAANNAFVYEYNTAEFSENFLTGRAYSLYGVYPFNQLQGAEDAKAYINTIRRRVNEGMHTLKCQTLAYMSNAASRLGSAETALELINHIIKSCVMDNLVTADNDWRNMGITDTNHWSTYQITGNTELCAAITSLFIYSKDNQIYILPCGKMFNRGEINGLLTRCGAEVDLSWDAKVIKITLKSRQKTIADIVLPPYSKRIVKGPLQKFNEDKVIKDVQMQGAAITFHIKI